MARWTLPLCLVLAAGIALAAFGAHRLQSLEEPSAPTSLLYLPKGPFLRLTALGQEQLLADLLYIWAIQYYSSYEEEGRYRYLESVFTEAITELDPHYVDAYWMGALIMSLEAEDPDSALRLLDKGLERNPASWRLAYVAGWEAYMSGRYDRASAYFDRARTIPGAPAHLERTYAATLEKLGRPVEALSEWWRLRETSEDAYVRSVADRWIPRLTARLLEEAAARYREERGAPPPGLAALGDPRLLPLGLLPADWAEYPYDPATGTVGTPEVRVVEQSR
jgi:tetratricopeptide (TPR) repeat protein